MESMPIVFYDSGIGGISLLKKVRNKFPCEDYVYFADYGNMPYGDKTKDELDNIFLRNIKKIVKYDPKLIVVACNTLSTNCLLCDQYLQIPIIGVKPIAEKSTKGLLICTMQTAKSSYVNNLKKDCPCLSVEIQKGLAEEIENHFRFNREIDLKKRFLNYRKDYDYISLGCTHYSCIRGEISKIFPTSRILDGIDISLKKIENFLPTSKRDKIGKITLINIEKSVFYNTYMAIST